MTNLAAFVGHSFLEEDEQVVNRFTRLFDSMTRAIPGFSWDHALAAKPISISEKVLGIADGKKVFIAICTKRERVTQALGEALPDSDKLAFSPNDFKWKTSDWIIQETGLAKGLGLSSIILVENDVRPPSGLLSDLEYIPFDRINLEACTPQLLDMIGSLLPKSEVHVAVHAEAKTSPPPVDPQGAPSPADNAPQDVAQSEPPKKDWNFALFEAFIKRDAEGQQRIFDDYLATEDAKAPERPIEWSALRERLRVECGTGGSISALKHLVNQAPNNAVVLHHLGNAYLKFNEYSEAATSFEQAAARSKSNESKVSRLGMAARAYRKAGDITSFQSMLRVTLLSVVHACERA